MTLLQTPLDALHRELGARMVPFAGYDMPVQYSEGIIREHLHTRQAAGLFDVSHMGQLVLRGPGSAELLESLVPADVVRLGEHCQTYALLTTPDGTVLDDLIITRWGPETFFLVVNAACKTEDIAHLRRHLSGQTLEVMGSQALLALQGPTARAVMSRLCPQLEQLTFMRGLSVTLDGVEMYVTCSGYTGEDGFELSLPGADAEMIARKLLAQPEVAPIGLGARDSLRLEAGLCLYGHELSQDIDLVRAGLFWSVGKARRPGAEREGGFPGADRVLHLMEHKPALRRVGLQVEGKRPVREGQAVLDAQGKQVGEVCSAGFGATVGGPIAMAYVERALGEPGTALAVDVRGKALPVTVAAMPFVPQRYFRG